MLRHKAVEIVGFIPNHMKATKLKTRTIAGSLAPRIQLLLQFTWPAPVRMGLFPIKHPLGQVADVPVEKPA